MKKYIIPVAAFIAGMAIVPGAFADSPDVADEGTIKDWATLEKCLSGSEAGLSNADTCTLGADFSVDVAGAILGDKNITLDLNGHKLTNTNGGTFIKTGKGSFTITGNGNSAIESAGAIVDV